MRRCLYVAAVVLPLGLAAAWAQGPAGGRTEKKGEEPGSLEVPARPAAEPARGGQPTVGKSRIVKVTVYPNSALVTREVDVPAGAGLVELVVPELPERVQDNSLYSEGSDGLRVLSTRYRTRPVLEDTREDVRKLEDELKRLQQTAERIQSEAAALQQNLQMLAKLENFTTVSTVQATEKGGLNGDNVITLTKYIMEQRGERAKELVALQQALQLNKEQSEFAQRKLRDLTAGSSRVERDAVLVVDRAGGAGGRVRLNYLADAASWRPLYKLRAGKAKEPVQLDYLAAVVQQTGEDWAGVDLTLSTAQPMLNAAPPDLVKLEVAVIARPTAPPAAAGGPGGGGRGGLLAPGAPGPHGDVNGPLALSEPLSELGRKASALRQEAVNNYNSNKDARRAIAQINEAAAWEQTRDLMKSSEELAAARRRPGAPANDTEGPSVTYHLPPRLTVPSRNDEQVIEIAKLRLEPRYYYKAVPVLGQHVYRLAELANQSEHVLLPGEATMYQGADFVGRMALPLVAIGEEFTAGFGVDPQLQIQRQMVDKARTTQGGNQVLTYKYRIQVNSYKSEPVKLQVWDRLPHAETETAGITLTKTSPEVSKDALYERESRPHNLLRWDLDVEPHMTGERALAIHYEFRLELDRNMAISGLVAR